MELKMVDVSIVNKNNETLANQSGYNVDLCYKEGFKPGDKIIIKLRNCNFIKLNLDGILPEAVLYVPNKTFVYEIPFEKAGRSYMKTAFDGNDINISVIELEDEEIYAYRNLALNPYDFTESNKAYPHATANFVTRGDACFEARNAIDGSLSNDGHGNFPYQSWAGGARDGLEFTLDFGRRVEVDKLVFYLRADFPHDTYWESIDVEFSDNTKITGNFIETGKGQEIILSEKKLTKTIKLSNFKQAVFPLSFAALTQIEVYGKYEKEDFSKMEVRNASNSKDVKHYTTERLREEFHISNLFSKDNIRMVYSHIDRIITCGLMPVFQTLKLEAGKELAADYFLQRREAGCINIGGKGIITIDGKEYEMQPRDGIYIGRGNKDISFKSVDSENPAKFYLSSCPAHKEYPTVKIDISKAKKVPSGNEKDANKRVINQYIHPEVMQSCQLAMGLTELEEGSVWNTMPTHTHDRRMEVYLYLDIDEDAVVFHIMGEPKQTRHIIMHNEEAVISPSWSIHSGVGTRAYSFIWAMCGENQEFTDMDAVETNELL